jgi:serine/threonine-protein kinase
VTIAPAATTTATPEIDFTIRATPATATIAVDGAPLSGNPTSGKRPRDGAIHVVRVEATGYEPREESITFDRSVLVALDLHPLPPPEPTSKKVRQRR